MIAKLEAELEPLRREDEQRQAKRKVKLGNLEKAKAELKRMKGRNNNRPE